MPFYRAWEKLGRIPDPLKAPKKVRCSNGRQQAAACNPPHAGCCEGRRQAPKHRRTAAPAAATPLQPRGAPRAAQVPVAEASPVQACGGVALAELKLYDPPLDLEGRVVDWGAGIAQRWEPSEGAALQLLDRFLTTGLQHYEVGGGGAWPGTAQQLARPRARLARAWHAPAAMLEEAPEAAAAQGRRGVCP
jgi:hypothetical protein